MLKLCIAAVLISCFTQFLARNPIWNDIYVLKLKMMNQFLAMIFVLNDILI